MSTICLCVTNITSKDKVLQYQTCISSISQSYERGVTYSVEWSEPITKYWKADYMVVNFLDCPTSSNCEMLLLPDGWFYNGHTNHLPFNERICFLFDVAAVLIGGGYPVEFYIGYSGMELDEYTEVEVKICDLTKYLINTIGVEGIDVGRHIRIIL